MSKVLLDVGGTNTRLATIDDGNLKLLAKVETNKDTNPLNFLQELIASHLEPEEVESTILALPGETKDTTLIQATNLPNWNGTDFKHLTTGQLKVINDADAAALGEAHYGAGKDYSRFGYITISTGIGGGLVERGKLASQQLGFEVGKQIVDWQNAMSLEQLAGGASVQQRTGMLTGQLSSEAEINLVARQLASGLFNVVLLWSTNRLVINGPSFFESETLYKNLLEELDRIVVKSGLNQPINISLAGCGDEAGLYGCMHLAVAGEDL